MENYICKIASKDELIERWNYLIEIHPGNDEWVKYKENAIRNFDDNSTISYLGILDDKSICEITAYIKESAFIGDIDDPKGLLTDKMSYLAAFRTDKEYEGKGYFKKLFNYVINDLKNKGYTEVCLGVGPEAIRNIQIYFHLGFKEYVKTVIQYDPEEDVIIFYKKKI